MPCCEEFKLDFTTEYMLELNNCDNITVLNGKGVFKEYGTDELYTIHSIKLPFTSSGKHITVYCKESGLEDTVMDFSYLDGKILEFEGVSVEHW